MRKKRSLLCFVCLLSFANTVNAGLKDQITKEYPRFASILAGTFIAGNMASNIVATYFQMQQSADWQNINYFDNEPGVPEEDKACGEICRENSKALRQNAKHSTNWNYLASVLSFSAISFDFVALSIWGTMQCNWEIKSEYEKNVDKFSRIALGISAVRAIFNLASTSYTIDTAIYHIKDLPEETIARFQIAAFRGMGYWVPMILHGGYGLISFGTYIETFRQMLDKAITDKAPEISS